jgi:7-keto-8-aminopelargonate synthetase-like enzyme
MDDAKSFTVFAGTDYLGLSTDEFVIATAARAARDYGMGTSSSRIAMGTCDLHLLLEARLGRFLGTEDAFAYVSGYLGGLTYFGLHAGADCEVLIDERAHSSVRLGAQAYNLRITPFANRDAADLERRLAQSKAAVRVVATDGVAGMAGALAPLADFAHVAKAYDAALFVDDAHGVGVMGERGRGAAEYFGLDLNDLVVCGSLSKALGCGGGFIAGRKEVIDRVRRTPPATGATPITPAYAAASIAAIDLVESQPGRRAKLFENAGKLRVALRGLGLHVGGEPTPVVPIHFPDAPTAQAASAALHDAGLLCPWFDYGSGDHPGLLRAIARAVHTDDDIRRFEEALRQFLKG